MSLYVVAMGLTVVANISYHLCQKAIQPNANPLVSLIATYATALVCSLVSLPILYPSESLSDQLKVLNWASFGLGLAIIALELGFLLAYRAGWNISLGALYSNVLVTAMLLPIGILFFKESLSRVNILGIALALTGLYLAGRR